MKYWFTVILYFLLGFSAAYSSTWQDEPTTRVLVDASRFYLLFSATRTTRPVIEVSFDEGGPGFIIKDELRLVEVEKIFIFWPGKSGNKEDIKKVRQIFESLCTREKVFMTSDLDHRVYELCRDIVRVPYTSFQNIQLDTLFLKNLRSAFPGDPPPLGVHIVIGHVTMVFSDSEHPPPVWILFPTD